MGVSRLIPTKYSTNEHLNRRSPSPPRLDFPSSPSLPSSLSPPRPRSHPTLVLRPTQNPANTLQNPTYSPAPLCPRAAAVPYLTYTTDRLRPLPALPHNPPASPPPRFPFCLVASLLRPIPSAVLHIFIRATDAPFRELAEIRV